MKRLLGLALALVPGLLAAHPLAPALLELRQQSQGYAVLWRTPVAQVRGAEVAPRLPAECRTLDAARREIRGSEAIEQRWTVGCADLSGSEIAIAGLDGAGINVVLRIEQADGRVISGIIEAREPRFQVPAAVAPLQRFNEYFTLGVGHLLGGLDHVLFVLGLLLLVRGARALVLTVTAFTLGHSLTLGAAALGWVRVNPALTELGIALSLVVVALAILRPASSPSLLRRRPAAVALAFGLLHGLGFAGALSQVGLPAGEIPLSLLAFNLGIEAGQLMLVAVALAIALLVRSSAQSRLKALLRPGVPAYIIGSLAACWCIERTLVLAG